MSRHRVTPEQRVVDSVFLSRVDRSAGPQGCWPWLGVRNAKGYPKVGDYRLTRVVLEAVVGRPLGVAEHALHHCDNPPCLNPAHLFIGTAGDNVRDMVAKDRQPAHMRPGAAR